jgi:hypothetical protein
MAVERAFKALKQELSMEEPEWRVVAKIRMHVAICFSYILAAAIAAHKIGRPELANNIAASSLHILKTQKNAPKAKTSQKQIIQHLCAHDWQKFVFF